MRKGMMITMVCAVGLVAVLALAGLTLAAGPASTADGKTLAGLSDDCEGERSGVAQGNGDCLMLRNRTMDGSCAQCDGEGPCVDGEQVRERAQQGDRIRLRDGSCGGAGCMVSPA